MGDIRDLRARFARNLRRMEAPEPEPVKVEPPPVEPPARIKLDIANAWVGLHLDRDHEVVGGGYLRTKLNLEADMVFPAPTGNWGTVAYVALYSAQTGGEPIAVQPITTAKAILNGDAAPLFVKGALTIDIIPGGS